MLPKVGFSEITQRRKTGAGEADDSRPSWGSALGALENLVEQAAVGEVRCLGTRPTAEVAVDRKHLELRKILGVFRRHLRIARAVIIPGDDFLGFRRVEELQIGLRYGLGAVLFGIAVNHRDRRLGEDRKSVVSGKSVSVRVDLGGR